jgi:hypothetical protein
MTTKEKYMRRLCAFWWKFRHGRLTGKFSIPKGGLKPKHLLIVMPPEFHDFDVALHVLVRLIEHMNPAQTTVLVRENFRTWLSADLGVKIVTFDGNVKNWLGFPPDPLCDKVKDLEADIVVDLTPGFSPFTAALAAATGAPLRVSVDEVEWSDFYNFYISLDGAKSLAERYDVLLRYV